MLKTIVCMKPALVLVRGGVWKKSFMRFFSKGQLISKCLFGVFKIFQNTNENKSTWGIIVVKANFFVRFLEELRIPKSSFEINWPLVSILTKLHSTQLHTASVHERKKPFRCDVCETTTAPLKRLKYSCCNQKFCSFHWISQWLKTKY